MHVFAIALFLGLMVMLVAGLVTHHVKGMAGYRMHVLVLFGIGAAWLADFNLWKEWGIAVREDWVGVTLTGIALAGFAHLWASFFDFTDSMTRKVSDEAMAMEKEHHLKAA